MISMLIFATWTNTPLEEEKSIEDIEFDLNSLAIDSSEILQL